MRRNHAPFTCLRPDRLIGLAISAAALGAVWTAALAEEKAESPAKPGMSAADLEKAIDARRKGLEDLESAQLKAKSLEADVDQLASEREKLNARLLETAALIQKSEGAMTKIEARLSELEAQEKLVRGSLEERHGEIAELLAALQRIGRNPPPVMITKRQDALEMVRSAMLLSSAFPELRTQALEVSGKLDALVKVMDGIHEEKDKLQAETDTLQAMRTRLSGLMAAKKQSITERQAELVSVRQAAAEISKNVSDLNELIAKLDKAVTDSTGLGAYQAENKAAENNAAETAAATPSTPPSAPSEPSAGPSPLPTPPAGPAASPAALPAVAAAQPPATGAPAEAATAAKPTEVAALMPPKKPAEAPKQFEPAVLELAPSTGSLVPGSPGRIKPAISFASARGRLPLPAQGRRVLTFGDKTQFGNTSKGIVLETRSSAQVTAPCDGWVVYAGEFRSYGQLLIINAGGGYHVLLAGMSQIDVEPGQFVLAAEPVGTMGGMPKPVAGGGESGGPVLYVEFRKDGDPVDPDPWWVSGQQKVQN